MCFKIFFVVYSIPFLVIVFSIFYDIIVQENAINHLDLGMMFIYQYILIVVNMNASTLYPNQKENTRTQTINKTQDPKP
jgi:uncharacterized membrane protein